MCFDEVLIYYSVISCKAFQRILFGLNTYKRNSFIFCREELTFCSRCDSYPITCSESNFFSVNNDFSFTGKDAVNFFIVLMRVYERNVSSCRKAVHSDVSTHLFVTTH